eukprot:scaffold983_cov96-Skeletonema_dohrnii-CCMP3373.AAC.7
MSGWCRRKSIQLGEIGDDNYPSWRFAYPIAKKARPRSSFKPSRNLASKPLCFLIRVPMITSKTMDTRRTMPPSERRVRRRLVGSINEANPAVAEADDGHEHDDDLTATINQLTGNVLTTIFGFLPLTLKDILRLRCVCSDWKEAAKGTFFPSEFHVDSVHKFRAMETLSPNLQHLSIFGLPDVRTRRSRGGRNGEGSHIYILGDNPYESYAAAFADSTVHDVGIISNFQHLRSLAVIEAPLNGEYPVLFNFPLLEKLTINDSFDDPNYIKWDLKMLEGLPMLRELECRLNYEAMSGNISSLIVLKDTLEQVVISGCRNIVGNFMDLADFPRLKMLDLRSTSVTGDIRDIDANDFKVLKELHLPRTVYGGSRYEFQSIAEVSVFMSQIYPLAKRFSLSRSWRLSEESPDWYDDPDKVEEESDRKEYQIPPPFVCELVILKGTRIGWRWRCNFPDTRIYFYGPWKDYEPIDPLEEVELTSSCEINWLEPEPDRESSNYEDYTLQLSSLQKEITFYRGHRNPPTKDEYKRLRYENESSESEDFDDEESYRESYREYEGW